MKNEIGKKDMINTLEGYLLVTDYNGSIVYVDEYHVCGEHDELELIGGRMYTLSEIGHMMKEVDGLNHTVTWDYDR